MNKIKIEISFIYKSVQNTDIAFFDNDVTMNIKSKIIELHPKINLNEVSEIRYKRID